MQEVEEEAAAETPSSPLFDMASKHFFSDQTKRENIEPPTNSPLFCFPSL